MMTTRRFASPTIATTDWLPASGLATAFEANIRSEEHTSELQSQSNLVCRLLLEKQNRVSRTTSSLAAVLRVTPLQGRWFTEEEGAPGALPVAVLSHGLWVRRYGQRAGGLGERVP